MGYAAPFGVAPVGGSMLIWPGAEQYLASMAVRRNIPYCMPFFTSAALEKVSEITKGMGWYQLYAPNDTSICDDIVHRADVSKYEVLVFTVDTPRGGRRDRFFKAKGELKSFNLLAWWRTIFRPAWMCAALLNRSARIEIIQRYSSKTKKVEIGDFVGGETGGVLKKLNWDYLARLRDQWKRPLVVKGILHPEDARRCRELGVDSVWISNHGARQLDAFPSTMTVLPEIRREVGDDYPLIIDSGVRSGTDVVRALALGADFVMLGRPFLFGIGALGRKGADHVADIIETQIIDTMMQVGINRISDLTRDICLFHPD